MKKIEKEEVCVSLSVFVSKCCNYKCQYVGGSRLS